MGRGRVAGRRRPRIGRQRDRTCRSTRVWTSESGRLSSSTVGRSCTSDYSPNPNDGPDVVMPSFSVAKSITSALVGVLVRDGLINVNDPAPVPEWHEDADDPRAEITIEHLLQMSSGLPWRDSFRTGSNTLALATSSDMAAYAADFPLNHEPGTHFEYNSGSTVLLDRMIGDIVRRDGRRHARFHGRRALRSNRHGAGRHGLRRSGYVGWFLLGQHDGARLRQVRSPLRARRRLGWRPDHSRGMGRILTNAERGERRVRRSVVARPDASRADARDRHPGPGDHR